MLTPRIIIPKTYAEVPDRPIVFLAGPVRGGGSWQDDAIDLLLPYERLVIAAPVRDIAGRHAPVLFSDYHAAPFRRQLDWEQHYLMRAGTRGAILFWTPVQREDADGHEYARDTRGEVGEWRGRIAENPSYRVVMGGEGEFPGLDVMRRNNVHAAPSIAHFGTLEATCEAAARLAYTSNA